MWNGQVHANQRIQTIYKHNVASISILQLNLDTYTPREYKYTQLSNGIRPYFAVADEDWQCDTNKPLPFHQLVYSLPLCMRATALNIMFHGIVLLMLPRRFNLGHCERCGNEWQKQIYIYLCLSILFRFVSFAIIFAVIAYCVLWTCRVFWHWFVFPRHLIQTVTKKPLTCFTNYKIGNPSHSFYCNTCGICTFYTLTHTTHKMCSQFCSHSFISLVCVLRVWVHPFIFPIHLISFRFVHSAVHFRSSLSI